MKPIIFSPDINRNTIITPNTNTYITTIPPSKTKNTTKLASKPSYFSNQSCQAILNPLDV